MKLIKRVNLLDDKKLIMKLNILTIPLLVIFFAVFTLLTLNRKLSEEVTIDLMYLVIAILTMAGLIIIRLSTSYSLLIQTVWRYKKK